jgi:hypothetical protein
MRELQTRIRTLISLLTIIPVGFYSKFYAGPAAHWVNNSLGGVFYEIFWCLFFFLFFYKSRPWFIGLTVLVLTSMLEFLQLYHPPFLEFFRGYFIGSTILGTTFAWSDFPYYFVGAGLGCFWIWLLQRAGASRGMA